MTSRNMVHHLIISFASVFFLNAFTQTLKTILLKKNTLRNTHGNYDALLLNTVTILYYLHLLQGHHNLYLVQ